MELLLIKLFSNYQKENYNLSFKNYIKKEIGEDWIYQISNKFNIRHNDVSKKVEEYQLINDFINSDNIWNIKL